MKRLLAYLFIVLGLGLTFSVSAHAKINEDSTIEICGVDHDQNVIYLREYSIFNSYGLERDYKKSKTFKDLCSKFVDKSYNKNLHHYLSSIVSKKGKGVCGCEIKINRKDYNILIEKYGEPFSIDLSKVPKTQIAKAEPSQTQKVAEKVDNFESNQEEFFCSKKGKTYHYSYTYRMRLSDKCSDKIIYPQDEYYSMLNEYYVKFQAPLQPGDLFNLTDKLHDWIFNNKIPSQTQIAKTEPSQTQNQIIELLFCKEFKGQHWYEVFIKEDFKKCPASYPINVNYKEHQDKKDIFICYEKNSNAKLSFLKTDRKSWCEVNHSGQIEPVIVTANFDGQKIFVNGDYSKGYLEISGKNQIAKKEPTVKPKKKVKVAKVEDSTQEEFKPKKTNQDNEAPVIEIAEAITVNDTDYEFQGKVTDQAKTIYVEVDGRPTDVKNGKFIVKGYSPIDKQISIEAIDQWGNRSEPKIVKLTIDIKDTSIAERLEPLNPSKIRSKSSNNKVALIIGIENYLESPNAKYANLDAKYFFDYARKGFGVKKQNINLLVDEDATFVKTNKALTKWLRSKIKSGQSDLIIFFAGHGLASSDGKELYLLPQDSDPDLLARTALSRTELFQEIINLNPKSVTMFLDTCYSGVSRDEQMLLASARPIRIVADEQSEIPNNFTIFSASKLDQISSGLKEANHGIFSYYLMKGLEGNADSNEDKKITNGELLAYMDLNVSQKASELGRQQNPSLSGDPDKVLMSYR